MITASLMIIILLSYICVVFEGYIHIEYMNIPIAINNYILHNKKPIYFDNDILLYIISKHCNQNGIISSKNDTYFSDLIKTNKPKNWLIQIY